MAYPAFNKKHRLISALSYVPITPLNFAISTYSLMARKDKYARFHAIQSILMNLGISIIFLGAFVVLFIMFYPVVEAELLDDPVGFFLDWGEFAAKITPFRWFFTLLSLVITFFILVPIHHAYVGKEIRIPFVDKWAEKNC